MGECGGVVDAVADHRHGLALTLQAADDVDLLLRQHLRIDPFDADLGGDLLGDRLIVASEQHRSQAEFLELADRFSAGGLDLVGDHEHTARLAVPADSDRGLALRLGLLLRSKELIVEMDRPAGEQRLASGEHGVAVDDALHAFALDVLERFRRRQLTHLGGGTCGDGLSDRVLGVVLQAARDPQQLLAGGAVGGEDVGERHLSGGNGAGLVQHDRVHALRGFQYLRSFDEHAHLRAPPGADQQRRGRREAQRAGAGDDQYGDGGGEPSRERESGPDPRAECGHRDSDRDRHEHPGDAICQTLDLGLARLGLLDELGHLGQLGIGADPGGLNHEASSGVHCGAGDVVALADLDGDGLAGQHGRIDRRATGGDDPVGGDLLAGPDDELVTDAQLLDRDPLFSAAPQDRDLFRAEFEQGAEGGSSAAFGALLEVPAEQDEGDHPGGDL